VAARYMQQAGYTDISTFVAAIRQANLGQGTANVLDWQGLAAQTVITIPHATN
jgi:hypothetical protein